MEKLIYLLDRGNSAGALLQQLRENCLPALQQAGARQIVINIADLDSAVVEAAPQRIAGPWQEQGAVVSLWLDSVDCHPAIERILASSGCQLAGYLVTESIPQHCERSWGVNERRPGVTQFTAHGKPEHISESDFYRNWREHTVLSFELHPSRWSYVRNAVARALDRKLRHAEVGGPHPVPARIDRIVALRLRTRCLA